MDTNRNKRKSIDWEKKLQVQETYLNLSPMGPDLKASRVCYCLGVALGAISNPESGAQSIKRVNAILLRKQGLGCLGHSILHGSCHEGVGTATTKESLRGSQGLTYSALRVTWHQRIPMLIHIAPPYAIQIQGPNVGSPQP